MTGDNPIFIDQFGTGSGSHGVKGLKGPMNGEPMWKLAWRGHAPLWRAFWVYFVMGHGVILGLGCGVLVLSLLAGFIVNPSSSTSGMAGLALGGTMISLVFLVFAVWAVVTVWRCANNCTLQIRGTYARALMIGYVTTLALPIVKYVIG